MLGFWGRKGWHALALGGVVATFMSCSAVHADRAPRILQTGVASFYGRGFEGRKTANGERFRSRLMTAAHRTLPLGTRVRVRNIANGKEVLVRINDRGPYVDGRVIDVSHGVAKKLGFEANGLTQVEILPE